MASAETIQTLREAAPGLRARYGVVHLDLFGSVARGEAKADSDLDVLVRLASGPTYDQYFDLKLFLEDLLGRKVDLITQDGLHPKTRKLIDPDLIRVA